MLALSPILCEYSVLQVNPNHLQDLFMYIHAITFTLHGEFINIKVYAGEGEAKLFSLHFSWIASVQHSTVSWWFFFLGDFDYAPGKFSLLGYKENPFELRYFREHAASVRKDGKEFLLFPIHS